MEILRTPDERFLNLPGYPISWRDAEVGGLKNKTHDYFL